MSRILRLALLAPDIIEAILGGRADQALIQERLGRPLPASWKGQREMVCLETDEPGPQMLPDGGKCGAGGITS